MGSTLTNTQPKDTYKSILKTSDTTELSATAKYVSDGNGNDSALALSTSAVGIGTSGPQSILEVKKISTNFGKTSELGLLISNTGVGGQYAQIGFGYSETTCAAAIGGVITSSAGATNSALVFGTRSSTVGSDAPTERMRITSDGYLRMAAGSGGIQFSGDTSANNALSDYEIGTFTVSLNPGTSGTITLNSSYTTWTYTKIGRQVTVNGVAVISSVSSPVGSYVRISGLPFTIQNYSGAYGGVTCMFVDDSPFDRSPIGAWHSINETYMYLAIDAATIAGNDEFYVTATYFV